MRRPKVKTPEQLEAECIVWNHHHPIGTAVHFHPIIGEPEFRPGETTTAAYVMGGHTAVVHLNSERGCVALEACSVPGKEVA